MEKLVESSKVLLLIKHAYFVKPLFCNKAHGNKVQKLSILCESIGLIYLSLTSQRKLSNPTIVSRVIKYIPERLFLAGAGTAAPTPIALP